MKHYVTDVKKAIVNTQGIRTVGLVNWANSADWIVRIKYEGTSTDYSYNTKEEAVFLFDKIRANLVD